MYSHDLEEDVAQLANDVIKLRKENKDLRHSELNLSNAISGMLMAFHCLTIQGGWDTMNDEMKLSMLEYREEARKVLLGDSYEPKDVKEELATFGVFNLDIPYKRRKLYDVE